MTINKRIFSKDSSLWATDKACREKIDNRLGWVDAVEFSRRHQANIETFAESVRERGFKQVLLLGMGGSCLAPEVFARTFTKQANGLELLVLDSACSRQILATEDKLDMNNTLFVVSSKSGGTIETKMLYRYFYQQVCAAAVDEVAAGQQFVAITDDGSELEQESIEKNFLHCFVNPSDIGGRFSALSYFGLVPAALLGISVGKLLDRAEIAVAACQEMTGEGVRLGEWLVSGYQEQKLDKLLLLTNEQLSPLVWWIEQLVAESLGKLGQGIFPMLQRVESTTISNPFAKTLTLSMGGAELSIDDEYSASWGLQDEYDVAAQFFHWEFATAVAAVHMDLNPFDEPNVTEAKVQTQKLLAEAEHAEIAMPESVSVATVLTQVQADSYVGILAYFPIEHENQTLLSSFRQRVAERRNALVAANFGPRYLHSTGQIHKGGKRQGVFIILIEADETELHIPETSYSFRTLCRAQAFGDYQALREKGLPVAIIELDSIQQLAQLPLD